MISIHAPRVGRDRRQRGRSASGRRFQSTRPVWGATRRYAKGDMQMRFQSTRPVWGATLKGFTLP